MMTVNGLQFPASFVKFFEEQRYTNWDLKEKIDVYGNPLETDFEPLSDLKLMEEDTAALARNFEPRDLSKYSLEIQEKTRAALEAVPPGFLSTITDFSKIVQFGRTGAGAPFCFDFRENAPEPSVIHWDDGYGRWRRVAPNFDTFTSLFEPVQDEEG